MYDSKDRERDIFLTFLTWNISTKESRKVLSIFNWHSWTLGLQVHFRFTVTKVINHINDKPKDRANLSNQNYCSIHLLHLGKHVGIFHRISFRSMILQKGQRNASAFYNNVNARVITNIKSISNISSSYCRIF